MSKSLKEHNEHILRTTSNKRCLTTAEVECPECGNTLRLEGRFKLEPKNDYMTKDGVCDKCELTFEVYL